MEVLITDLLEDIPVPTYDLVESVKVSENRIKHLTREKIHHNCGDIHTVSRRSIAKIAILAAVVVCLSISVFAVLNAPITQWFYNKTQDIKSYDTDLYIGSVSKTWEVGEWTFELRSQSVSASGMTVLCTESKGSCSSGQLFTSEAYWLEKWNGRGYDRYKAEVEPGSVNTSIEISQNTTTLIPINWKALFGELTPGYYRLGLVFRNLADSGSVIDLPCYVKFRILDVDCMAYYDQYMKALHSLRNQQNWHVTLFTYLENTKNYSSYSHEIIKHGDDYWEEICYWNENGMQIKHNAAVYVNGKGYRLAQNDENENQKTMNYQPDATVRENTFTYWFSLFELSDARLSEVTLNENEFIFTEQLDAAKDMLQTVLILDDNSQIVNIKQYRLRDNERTLLNELTIRSTDLEENHEFLAGQFLE